MWKYKIQPDRPEITKNKRMRIACWIPRATNTPSDYAILIVFPCKNGWTNVTQWYVIRTLHVSHTQSYTHTHSHTHSNVARSGHVGGK